MSLFVASPEIEGGDAVEADNWATLNDIQCGNYLWNKFSNFKTNDICRKC
jgi:hypothetical protein